MINDRLTHLHTFIRLISTAVSTSLLYSLDHQQVTRLCSTAVEQLKATLGDEPEVALMLIDDDLVAWDRPLLPSMYVNRFSQILKNRGIGHVRIFRDIAMEEVVLLVKTLARQGSDNDDICSTDNLRFGQVEIKQLDDEKEDHAHQRKLTLADIPMEELGKFMEIYDEVRSGNKFSVSGISDIVKCFIDSFRQVGSPLLALAPLRAMDEYTYTHSTNVCVLNLAQAMSLGIDGPMLNEVGIAAMLHDIGKLYVPEEVLSKPGKLDDAEWDLIKQHPTKGAQRLLDTPGVPRLAVVTAYEHHLKYNLTGYPRVAENWQQNLCSHMTTISDVFDALRTKRAYRDAMSFAKISGIMLELAGTDLHPVLTKNFLRIIGNLPEQPPVAGQEQEHPVLAEKGTP
ncbi:HD domain-containing protein [Geobacter pelophilus]|uniref:HD domain-containing protein n=1 Tax=Geoanaerobacter pelophilus TaxID=60036 RepID=A0AAW4L5F1_9BACT|nr:HD domain-containing phosphohydrolase [Geoanaerobacter pelophilus]MBT0663790.1 HD domain-containing protein [Geoanaerobacter pelophilus]